MTAYLSECDGMVERFSRSMQTTMVSNEIATFLVQSLMGSLPFWCNLGLSQYPHKITDEKPNFPLFGFQCRSPTEAALLPPTPVQPACLLDYTAKNWGRLYHQSGSSHQTGGPETLQGTYQQNRAGKLRIVELEFGVLERYHPGESRLLPQSLLGCGML